jgi:hypothetical protein
VTRFRLLDPPHKGLRFALGALALEAGRTDCADAQQVVALKELARRTLVLLEDHARNEDEHVFPLLEAKVPGATAALHRDHELLDTQALTIVSAIEALDGSQSPDDLHEIYLDITHFQAEYLEHLLLEERTVEPMLWEHYTDDELIAGEVEVATSMPFEVLLEWFAVCVPARTVAENAAVLANMKSAVPPEAFDAILGAIRPQISAERLASILKRAEVAGPAAG